MWLKPRNRKNKTKQNYAMFQEKESNQGAWSLGSRGKIEENKKLVGAAHVTRMRV